MTFEGFVIFMGAISGIAGVLGTMFTQWLNRDKTGAEAQLIQAEAHKVDSEAHKVDSDAMAVLLKSTSDAVVKFTGMIDKRDGQIDTLQRQARESDAEIANMKVLMNEKNSVIQKLQDDMAALVESGAEKDKRITTLEADRAADRQRITALETERVQLLETVERLSAQLEAANNIKIVADGVAVGAIPVEKTPKSDGDGIDEGQ